MRSRAASSLSMELKSVSGELADGSFAVEAGKGYMPQCSSGFFFRTPHIKNAREKLNKQNVFAEVTMCGIPCHCSSPSLSPVDRRHLSPITVKPEICLCAFLRQRSPFRSHAGALEIALEMAAICFKSPEHPQLAYISAKSPMARSQSSWLPVFLT